MARQIDYKYIDRILFHEDCIPNWKKYIYVSLITNLFPARQFYEKNVLYSTH